MRSGTGKGADIVRLCGIAALLVVLSACGGPESGPVPANPRPTGPDVGQYFDRAIRSPGPANLADESSHPLRGLTTADTALRFAGTEDCLGCHDPSAGARVSDECVMCHFENQPNAPGTNHGDGVLQMAAVTGNTLPASEFPIAGLADYDAWCLQCHSGSAISLGGRFPSAAARTVLDPVQVASGRHRANAVGCIHCHAPHGSANARLVRENPVNRMSANGSPQRFGVFPGDNLSGGGYGAAQSVPYRARVIADVADADDANGYCNKACHFARTDASWSKEKMVKRDDATGLYLLSATQEKVYLVEGVERTIDNTTPRMHGHVNNEIIATDNMVSWYAAARGFTGSSRYKYPGSANADPAAFNNALSPLPFFPDHPDGFRDFTDGYLGRGLIRYRYTCSTCHDPHGSPLPSSNGFGGEAWPDLRLKRTLPADLCYACHR
jgi:predicted CXXCH cytochrome family protein